MNNNLSKRKRYYKILFERTSNKGSYSYPPIFKSESFHTFDLFIIFQKQAKIFSLCGRENVESNIAHKNLLYLEWKNHRIL